mmetsp:Transcript_12326/g.25457  ORF Transcript_12326/g.25457 Transcript_12326/m.25457 type:complete len:474 (+) Transcript_12326:341-1762(+)
MAAGNTSNNTYPPIRMTASQTTMIAGMGGRAPVHRIRTPNPQDVLSGRGGGINSHKGNKAFREWVNLRKEEYNRAQNKKEKIAVAMQVVRQVHQQVPIPGRFLQRDTTMMGGNSGQWWVEVNEAKALAKTTQALREGAPKIRQAIRHEETKSAKKRKRKAPVVAVATETPSMDDDTERLVLQEFKQDAASLKRYKSEQLLLPTQDYSVAIHELQENVQKARRQAEVAPSSPVPALVAPLTSNKAFKQMYGQSKEASQFNPLAMPAVDPFAVTPPLVAVADPADEIPVLSLDAGRTIQVDDIPPPPKRKKLPRVHSLALSDGALDQASDESLEFVNPFADESNVLASENDASVVKNHVPSAVYNQWNRTMNATVQDTTNGATENKSKVISIGGYLNRLLSFSSTKSDSGPLFRLNDENAETGEAGDYFFLDDVPDFDVASVSTEVDANNKNSSTSLIRRTSLTSRHGRLVMGKQ